MPRGERLLVPLVHDAIGITLAAFYPAALGWLGLARPTPLTAVGYGFLTSILLHLVRFPSMGSGCFGLAAQPRYLLLRESLADDIAFRRGTVARQLQAM